MLRAWAVLVASAAVYAVAVLWAAARLPDHGVALHVNTHGEVNAVGTRGDALSLSAMPGVFVFGLGAVLLATVPRLPARMINVPHREHWAEPSRLPVLRRMVAWDMAMVFSLPLLALSYLPVDLTLTTLDPAGHGQLGFVVAVGLLVVGLMGYIVYIATIRYRPHPPG